MNATRNRPSRAEADEGEATPAAPQVVPSIGPGSPSFFPLQTVLEISTSLGEIKANIAHLTKSVDSVKSDVKDLVKWKSLILGGAAVIGILFSVGGYLSGKYTFNIMEKYAVAPSAGRQPSIVQPTPQAPAAPKMRTEK